MEEIDSNEQEMIHNLAAVNALYKALAAGDTKIVAGLLATDLEWWFHGPQHCHHMMRMLTGEAPHTEFKFEPRSVATIDDQIVIVEGYEGANVYWVHVWALKDGLITRFREYFNTWLTVKELRVRPVGRPLGLVEKKNRSTVWRSQPRDLFRRSLPGLMLAI
ncbi:senescence associated gene 20-like [Cynara cardunculus var. scolymus]|uniref:Wound-induced protein, Wun1 n=1 Tax=Cynara cardunculus var. scolymus TaxID=59895 RepID=A0A103XCL2_CYNCS|nr:senescence associated gene 20-like [Cynara cardunculus var. scolymus]KVH88253.1 Wound-induced protein, Wun1 [Cynara cardunculus var. scolymus]